MWERLTGGHENPRGMAAEDAAGTSGIAFSAGASARQWAPYVGLAAVVFAAGAVAGALSGAAEASAFVPAVGERGDATGSFLYLLSVAAVMVVGGAFVATPTVVLLGLQGYQFGAALAALAGTIGTADALAAAGPAAAMALPALWLVAAIPLRGLHSAARLVRESPPPLVPTERLVGESVVIVGVGLAGLFVATTLATGPAPT